jgi:hypothetical protein
MSDQILYRTEDGEDVTASDILQAYFLITDLTIALKSLCERMRSEISDPESAGSLRLLIAGVQQIEKTVDRIAPEVRS